MKNKTRVKVILILILILLGLFLVTSKRVYIKKLDKKVDGTFQAEVKFPDWKGYIDDTLAMNSMYSFESYKDQGKLIFNINKKVEKFDLFINNKKIRTNRLKNGIYEMDISKLTKNGTNTIMVSNIKPDNLENAITIDIPYPEVQDGFVEEVNLKEEPFRLIEKIIDSDIDNGFSSAQMAVVKDGKLVYSNSWGYKNSYKKNGTRINDGDYVTNETMYDLASNTKMYATVYAIEYLVDQGKLKLDDKITNILGKSFSNNTIDIKYTLWKDNYPGLNKIKAWKSSITVKDLLMHRAGFQDSGHYHNKYFDQINQKLNNKTKNVLYVDKVNITKTLKDGINKTPLMYKPRTQTVYSDIDYMILGLIVEEITKEDLNTFLKETFWQPMGLKHITYNPLNNGFKKDDCAATELNGNTRDGLVDFPGVRKSTIKCSVHDEEAYYMMDGISGHAGLFANAEDLAKLASVMFTGGYGNNKFFSKDVRDLFISPQDLDNTNYGLGWWREADDKRVWYFGTQSKENTIGHQGWTGTLTMIDFENNMVIVFLTNAINTPIVNPTSLDNANDFAGRYYTTSTLGFVPQIIYTGLNTKRNDLNIALDSLLNDMINEKDKLIKAKEKSNGKKYNKNHPIKKAKKALEELKK